MNKKQLIIILVILFHSSVFAHAGTVYSKKAHRNEKPGEFASPTGVFNLKLDSTPLDTASEEEFVVQGLFPRKSIFKDINSREFRGPSGIFNQHSDEFRSSDLIFKSPKDEFNSEGLTSSVERRRSEKESFSSPDKGELKFSFPKKKK
jgi:hypothetical protein